MKMRSCGECGTPLGPRDASQKSSPATGSIAATGGSSSKRSISSWAKLLLTALVVIAVLAGVGYYQFGRGAATPTPTPTPMATMSDAAKLWCAANDDPTAGDDIVAAAAEQLGIKVPPEVAANIEAARPRRVPRTSGAVPVPDDVAEAFIETATVMVAFPDLARFLPNTRRPAWQRLACADARYEIAARKAFAPTDRLGGCGVGCTHRFRTRCGAPAAPENAFCGRCGACAQRPGDDGPLSAALTAPVAVAGRTAPETVDSDVGEDP